MDISTEIAAVQAASEGSELRTPLVGALNKLNSGTLPAVTASDAGKILKVGSSGWEVGEKSGYIPVPTDTKQITKNGTHDVTNYASANVDVEPDLGTKNITENGTYNASSDDLDGYSSVVVNVQGGGGGTIEPLSVTQNGTYTPPSGVDGYAPVVVNVSGGGGGSLDISLIDGESYTTSEINLSPLECYQSFPDGFYFYNDVYPHPLTKSIVKDLGQDNSSFTVYYYSSIIYNDRNYPRILQIHNTNTTYYSCMFYIMSGYKVGYSTWNTDTATNIDSKNNHCYAVKCDLPNNIATFFIDGVKIGELRINATGRYVSFNGLLNNNPPQADAKYAAVVEGVQSDAKIIENMQTIMNYYAA